MVFHAKIIGIDDGSEYRDHKPRYTLKFDNCSSLSNTIRYCCPDGDGPLTLGQEIELYTRDELEVGRHGD